ncbi:MAG TPA: universal stress protein [Candidatus Acidoferrales bacterium]|nr:universal stress protein [Candidatus Acidoferrales bacterium]
MKTAAVQRTAAIQHGIQLKNILFLTDFSETANRAGEYAGALAKTYGAKLFALHVQPPVVNPMTPPASWYNLEEVAETQQAANRKELGAEFQGLNPRIFIKEGDLWAHVAAIVERENIDLIVMGTHGRSGMRRFFLGSIAEAMFRNAECLVLTVGPHATGQKQVPVEFTRIVFATDFSDAANTAAPYAMSLAQEHQAQVTLLHVVAETKAGELVQAHEVAASDEKLLRNLVPPEADQWCVPEFLIERGDAAEKILDVAARRKADLIVLGVRKEKGFPGASTHLPVAIAHEVVSKAQCPVLTVRG